MSGFENRLRRRGPPELTSRSSDGARPYDAENSRKADDSGENDARQAMTQRDYNCGSLQRNCGRFNIVTGSVPSAEWRAEGTPLDGTLYEEKQKNSQTPERCIAEKLMQSYSAELESDQGVRFLQALQRATEEEELVNNAGEKRLQEEWNASEREQAVKGEGREMEKEEREVEDEDQEVEEEDQESDEEEQESSEEEDRGSSEAPWVVEEEEEEHEKRDWNVENERSREKEYDETERLKQAGKRNKLPLKHEYDIPPSATSVASSQVDSIESSDQVTPCRTMRSSGSQSSAGKQSQQPPPPSYAGFLENTKRFPDDLGGEPPPPPLSFPTHGVEPRGKEPQKSLSRPLPFPIHGVEPRGGTLCGKEPQKSLSRPLPFPAHGVEPRGGTLCGKEPQRSLSRPCPIPPHGVEPRGGTPQPPEAPPPPCIRESRSPSLRPPDVASHIVEPRVGPPPYWRSGEGRYVDENLRAASSSSSSSGSSDSTGWSVARGRGGTTRTPCTQLKEYLDAKYPDACGDTQLEWRIRTNKDGSFNAKVLMTEDEMTFVGPSCSSKQKAKHGAAAVALRAQNNQRIIGDELQGLGIGIRLKGIDRKYAPTQNISNLVAKLGGALEWRVRQHTQRQEYRTVATISLPDRTALEYDGGYHSSIKKGKYAAARLALNDLATACGL